MSSTSSLDVALPPLDEYSLVGIWMSMVIYGMNILLYGSCIYILLWRHVGGQPQWMLLTTSTILFILSTMHIGASLRQLIEAFVYTPKLGILDASILYWTSITTISQKVKAYIYDFSDIFQDLVLIWRLWLVWGYNWKIVLLPFVLEVFHILTALIDTAYSMEKDSVYHSPIPSLTAWIVVVIVNILCTVGIAFRLWYMGRRSVPSVKIAMAGSIQVPKNRYLAPLVTVVESGAIFTTSAIVLLALYANNNALLEAAVNIATQLAATTPFLIIVRAGFGITHSLGAFRSRKSTVIQFAGSQTSAHPSSTVINVFRSVMTDATSMDNNNNKYQLTDMKPAGSSPTIGDV